MSDLAVFFIMLAASIIIATGIVFFADLTFRTLYADEIADQARRRAENVARRAENVARRAELNTHIERWTGYNPGDTERKA